MRKCFLKHMRKCFLKHMRRCFLKQMHSVQSTRRKSMRRKSFENKSGMVLLSFNRLLSLVHRLDDFETKLIFLTFLNTKKLCFLSRRSPGHRVSFIRIFFLENYSLFEYFLTEYSNNNFLLNKPYKNVNFQTIFPKDLLKAFKNPI
jgi:hypothetical protein